MVGEGEVVRQVDKGVHFVQVAHHHGVKARVGHTVPVCSSESGRATATGSAGSLRQGRSGAHPVSAGLTDGRAAVHGVITDSSVKTQASGSPNKQTNTPLPPNPTHHSDVSDQQVLVSWRRHSRVLKKIWLNCSLAKVAAGVRGSKVNPGACGV